MTTKYNSKQFSFLVFAAVLLLLPWATKEITFFPRSNEYAFAIG